MGIYVGGRLKDSFGTAVPGRQLRRGDRHDPTRAATRSGIGGGSPGRCQQERLSLTWPVKENTGDICVNIIHVYRYTYIYIYIYILRYIYIYIYIYTCVCYKGYVLLIWLWVNTNGIPFWLVGEFTTHFIF